ncbi:MAG: ribosome-associated translation inhibitor RaiA [Lentisphaeraceae bacterium]|nr:ribosome-associated translation inhibitor RaiA [Lentisphaeraceae bacterium]
MDIIVSARHMNHVPAGMRSEIEARVSKMSQYANLTKAECVMDKVKNGNYAEIVLNGKGLHLEAKSDNVSNLYEAIHQACDRMEKQIKKKQGKRRKHNSKHLGDLEVEILNISFEADDVYDFEDELEQAL